jgi:hypothetical protein
MNMGTKKDVVRTSRRVECLGPEQDVLMPDIYAHEYVVEETGPEAVFSKDESPDNDHSSGFNPYDTGVLYKK